MFVAAAYCSGLATNALRAHLMLDFHPMHQHFPYVDTHLTKGDPKLLTCYLRTLVLKQHTLKPPPVTPPSPQKLNHKIIEVLIAMERRGIRMNVDELRKFQLQAAEEAAQLKPQFREWATLYCPAARLMNLNSRQ